jgi:hypothetical protein
MLRLYADDGGTPGALLGEWNLAPPIRASGSTTAWAATLAPTPFVHAGTPYFIAAQLLHTFPSGNFEWWCSTNPPGPGTISYYRDSGQTQWQTNFVTPIAGLELSVSDCASPDFNHDGDVGTDQDIDAFFACLAGTCCPTCDSADINHDGDVGTDQDIEAFFRVLGGGAC